MDMEELHEFANILTQKEEEYNATVEQAANAFTQMDDEFENKIEQTTNAFTQMDEEFENEIEQAANALTEKELLKQSEMEYLEAKASGDVRSEKEYGNLTIIELTKSRFGIRCNAGFIVPFGKYEWIEGFDHGLFVFALMDSLAIQKILQPYLTMIGMKLRIEKSLKKKRPNIA